jgi:hypothetical protein
VVARFIRREFGRYLNKEQGFSLRVTYKNFPGMNIRYVEGSRTMNVFGELLANLKDMQLDLATFGHWDEPHASKVIDDAQGTIILERIVSALPYLGYVARPIGHRS